MLRFSKTLSRLRGAGAPAVVLLALVACNRRPEQPRIVRLSRAMDPSVLEGFPQSRELSTPSGLRVELVHDEDGLWLRTPLRREDWKVLPRGDVWFAPLPVHGIGRAVDGVPPCRLLVDGREVEGAGFTSESVIMRSGDGEAIPEVATVACLTMPWRRTGDGGLRVTGRRFSGEGFAVWSGQSVELETEVAPGAVLRFATCAERAFPLEESTEEVSFQVQVNGSPVLEAAQAVPSEGSYAWHEIALEKAGRARLTFAVSGDFAFTSFLLPTLGVPHEEEERRPDIVLFLADTFRADNLGTYGSKVGVTPNIDGFAERSLVFQRAWSTGTSTLPAHASLFTGLFPRQCGILGHEHQFPDGVVTIAGELSRSGYRTGAITDSVVVSQAFGLDRGYEWFDEHKGSLGSTLERAAAFLDADDGRPTFLYVHTYRTHASYTVSDEVRRELGKKLGFRGVSHAQAFESLQALLGKAQDMDTSVPGVSEALKSLHGLYLGCAADLDRGFGEFLSDLERRGTLDTGYVFFTSDHGEAFGEHGHLFHTGKVYEDQLRVPLMIHGPGIEPGTVDHAASLIDLAPTILGIAGVPVRNRLPGSSLLSLDEDRPVFAFQCKREPSESTLCVVEGMRKLIGLETAGDWQAFDLERDPGELEDLAAGDAGWPEEMVERYGPALENLLVPLFRPEDAVLDAEQVEALDAMGYGGE